MEGKRVRYETVSYDRESTLPKLKGVYVIESGDIVEKLGTIVGVFENGKVCVKCDEDKLVRLFNIEKLIVVDEGEKL